MRRAAERVRPAQELRSSLASRAALRLRPPDAVAEARRRRNLFCSAFQTDADVTECVHSGSLARGSQKDPINDVVGAVHDRMPMILRPEDTPVWLTGSPDDAFALLAPAPDTMVAVQRASSRVGNVRNDDPGLIAEESPATPTMPLFERTR